MPTAPKKVITGWAFYDWANSVYNLVITTTFFPIYFASVARDSPGSEMTTILGHRFKSTALYDYILAVAYLIIAVLYPILTAIADNRGNKLNFMRFFCYMGAAGCSALFFFTDKTLWLGISCSMLAAMGYVGSLVFYNAYLPEIAAPEDRDRISAKGFSYGYVGSVIMQLVGFALVLTMKGQEDVASRITFLLVGLWWVGFAQITFSRLPRTKKEIVRKVNVLTSGFREMRLVYYEVTKMPILKRFLRAFFFYSMGVQTVMLAAAMFGSKTLGLDATKLIITMVAIQLVAIGGAIGMSRLTKRFGNFRVLMGAVIAWILICIWAYNAASMKARGINPEFHFYGMAIAVGLIMGGIQSLSRSTYSKLMPETKDTASYFSYYDLTEKVAIVIGIFTFGFIEDKTEIKNSVLSLIIFFVIGLIWLYSAMVKETRIRKALI